MIDLITVLDKYVLSGVTGNSAFGILKSVWRRIRQKNIEDLYLDICERVLKEDMRDVLTKYAMPDGEIDIDRESLHKLLHQSFPLNFAPSVLSNAELHNLAQHMADKQVLMIGGHNLVQTEYVTFIEKLLLKTKEHFQRFVLENETEFNRICLEMALSNAELSQQTHAIVQDIHEYLFDNKSDQLRLKPSTDLVVSSHMLEGESYSPDASIPVFRPSGTSESVSFQSEFLFSLIDRYTLPDRNSNFVGRTGIINQLKDAITAANTIVVVGISGSGKSELLRGHLKSSEM